MSDISDNNIINEVFDANSDFLLRYLNANLTNPMGTNNMRDSVTNIINDLEHDISNSMVFPRNRRRRSRPSMRPELSDINPLFNHTLSANSDNLNNDYVDFIYQLFAIPSRRRSRDINSVLQSSFMDPRQNMYKNVLSKIRGNKSLTELAFITFPVSPIK